MTTAARASPAAAPAATWFDRAAAAYPLVLAYVAVLILTGWQASRHPTPWNFIDELKWAELSRGVAATGRPQLRLHDAPMGSLYTYLLAPSWWFGPTGTGYAVAKYVNAAVMSATLFPAYGLARLFAPRWPAFGAAVCTAVIPAVSYATMLIPESLAYFWSTLTLCLVARALLRPTRATIALAVLAVVVAALVRSQLAVLAAAALVAAATMLATGVRGRAAVRTWTIGEWIGAVVLFVGAAVAVNALLTHHSYTWQVGTHFADRMLDYGLWAAGAFAIGVGVLPVVVAVAWGLSARAATPGDRALLGLLLGSVTTFGLYAAVKASYISTVFAIRVEERNLIYLAPLVFAVTARWLVHGRARLAAVPVAAAGVGYVLWTTPYHMEEHFSVDAPGLALLSWLNRTWYWTPTDARRLLLVMLAAAAAAIVARELLARRPARRPASVAAVLAALGVAVVAWNVCGELAAADASNAFARDFRKSLPDPPDFVDRITGGERTLFIGQQLGNSNSLWSLEFWNRSIGDVWSVDASVPPPGPGVTPNFARADGTVDPQIPVRWAVSGGDVRIVGKTVATRNGLHVIRVAPPLRIASEVNGVTPDGWMGEHSWFAVFSGRPGVVTVSLSRSAACGDVAPARVTIRLGRVVIDENAQPARGRALAVERRVVHSTPCEVKTVRLRTRPPFRVDVTTRDTFEPSPYDRRDLSVQVTYSFAPSA